jgi:RimJ/RimL family protein N-acetyltransferase
MQLKGLVSAAGQTCVGRGPSPKRALARPWAVELPVTIGAGEDEVVIGGASYFVSDSVAATGRSAELAFTVEEDFQSRGIGSLLMRHIVAIVRVKGLDRLEADVLSRNRPMLNVFRRCGLPMAVRHEGDEIHVILSLREAG